MIRLEKNDGVAWVTLDRPDARNALSRAVNSGTHRIEARARGNNGAWSLPDGADFYAHRLRQSTTTDLTADQIHRIGLDQVARIHGEMERIKTQVGFSGTLQQFFRHIIDGNQYKYPNTETGRKQYLADASRYVDQVMAVALSPEGEEAGAGRKRVRAAETMTQEVAQT